MPASAYSACHVVPVCSSCRSTATVVAAARCRPAMILQDTTICSSNINAKPPAVLQRFGHYRMGEIGVCSVVAAELAYGMAKSGSANAAFGPTGS